MVAPEQVNYLGVAITVVSYRYIPDVIHQHLVQSTRPQSVFYDISDRQNSCH